MNQSCRDSEVSGGRPGGLFRPDSPGKTDMSVIDDNDREDRGNELEEKHFLLCFAFFQYLLSKIKATKIREKDFIYSW